MSLSKICILVAEWTLTLCLVFSLSELAKADVGEVESLYFHMRPRLGHLQYVDGYLKVYEEYFANVIQKNDKTMKQVDINDWRRVRPDNELCLDFLQGFQVKNYRLYKPYEIIILDSCLEWLYDKSDEKKTDAARMNKASKSRYDQLTKDAKLSAIWSGTHFAAAGEKLPAELKNQIYEYLMKLLKVNADHPKNGCHSLWLQSYSEFIEDVYLGDCEDEENCNFFGLDKGFSDTYLEAIVESTRQASKSCYSIMQKQMLGLMYKAYDDKPAASSISRKLRLGKVYRQAESNKWSKEMTKILQMIADEKSDEPIELSDVARNLQLIKQNDADTVDKFTSALAKYATENVNLKDSANGPKSREKYGKAMAKLCLPYIDYNEFLTELGGSSLWDEMDDQRRPFDFHNLIYSLIKLTNHEATFEISKDQFEEDVLANNWQALYMATLACQVVSITWGELDYETNVGEFKVSLRPNAQFLLEEWPVDILAERLHKEPDTSAGKSAERSQGNRARFSPKFGLKFKNLSSNLFDKTASNPAADKSEAPKPAPAAVPTRAPQQPPPAAAPRPEPTVAPQPKRASPTTRTGQPLISLETIEMYRTINGRYPRDLPANIEEIYPSLAGKIHGVYPRTAAVQPAPAPTSSSGLATLQAGGFPASGARAGGFQASGFQASSFQPQSFQPRSFQPANFQARSFQPTGFTPQPAPASQPKWQGMSSLSL